MTTHFFAIGLGIGTKNSKGNWLEVYYPRPLHQPDHVLAKRIAEAVGHNSGNVAIDLDVDLLMHLVSAADSAGDTFFAELVRLLATSNRPMVLTLLETDSEPASTPEAYLKLHLLSHRLVKPHGVNLKGIFPLLPNVAWTSAGAIDLEDLPARQLAARLAGEQLTVHSVDKFPRMVDYVLPARGCASPTPTGCASGRTWRPARRSCTRASSTSTPARWAPRWSRAGSARASSSATAPTSAAAPPRWAPSPVAAPSVMRIGRRCLLGAESGLGIALGDDCVVEAGLYVTAGTKCAVLDDKGNVVKTVKARELAGKSHLLFRRNSTTGAVECLTNKSAVELNAELHKHN
jgi:2,3,4,5-tetrahydropyridine-2-carboxylate N-succinyltransferase